jgi:hypothetical protein
VCCLQMRIQTKWKLLSFIPMVHHHLSFIL